MNKTALLLPIRKGDAVTRIMVTEWDEHSETFVPLTILPMSWFYNRNADDPVWVALNEGKDCHVTIDVRMYEVEDERK